LTINEKAIEDPVARLHIELMPDSWHGRL